MTDSKKSWSTMDYHERVGMLKDSISQNQETIFGGAASGVDPAQYTSLFFLAINNNRRLIDCTPKSLMSCLCDSAVYGLPINSVDGDGYMVPRQNSYKDSSGNWNKTWEAQFQAGYLGKLKLAYESPLIAGITADVAREHDVFSASLGTEQTIRHEPDPRGGKVNWVYAVCFLKSGARRCCVWTADDVEEHKKAYSQGWEKSKSAWQTSWKAMARKTVLLELLKLAPVSDKARRLFQREEYTNAGVMPAEGLKSGDVVGSDELDGVIGSQPEENPIAKAEPWVIIEQAEDESFARAIYDDHCGPDAICCDDTKERCKAAWRRRQGITDKEEADKLFK